MSSNSKRKLKVVELFAGVGGFRLGLEGWNGRSPLSGYKKKMAATNYEVVWSNQWEPSTKVQHASLVYEARFGKKGHSNEDISKVEVSDIPDHDVLVGGFPCQDYSVATTLKNSKGLIGKKGVLWWSIHKILSEKKKKPSYLILENVDRLLNSPSKQRGRDFAIILKSLNDLDYVVEWRVINAADYGMPQRRRRTFILAYRKNTNVGKRLTASDPHDWIFKDGIFANAFPVSLDTEKSNSNELVLEKDIVSISENFNKNGSLTPFMNSGISKGGKVYTFRTKPEHEDKSVLLKDIILPDAVDDSFYISEKDLDKWKYLKGAKKELRTREDGFQYNYSEGGMLFPDPLNKPSRTIITGEGGSSPSRFKHVIKVGNRYRRLTPIELERLNMFPDDHTNLDNISDTKRAFFMGNALVIGIVEKIGIALQQNF